MSSNSHRKRNAEKPDNNPPKKIVPAVEPTKAPYDVVINVDGQKFYCLKTTLSEHSEFIKRMLNSEFAEKNQTEIELECVDAEIFKLFLNSIENVDTLTDENVREAITVANYLEAPNFEAQCLNHFASKSAITLKKQFELADYCNSKNLMVQVCSAIKHASELHEVVPLHLNNLSKPALEIALQRSLELHGYRKPVPPAPRPEEMFEYRINEVMEQIEVQNLHGEVLADQLQLLETELDFEAFHIGNCNRIAQDEFYRDQKIMELLEQRQSSHHAIEQTYFGARILLEKVKHSYTAVANAAPDVIIDKGGVLSVLRTILLCLPPLIERNRRNRVGPRELASGNRPVDDLYRTSVAIFENQIVPPQTLENYPRWIRRIGNRNNTWLMLRERILLGQTNIPAGIRQILPSANFTAVDTNIRDLRELYYNYKLRVERHNGMQNRNNRMGNP